MTVLAGRTGDEDIPTACFATMAEHKSGARYICVTVGRITDDQPSVSASQSTEDMKTIYGRVRV